MKSNKPFDCFHSTSILYLTTAHTFSFPLLLDSFWLKWPIWDNSRSIFLPSPEFNLSVWQVNWESIMCWNIFNLLIFLLSLLVGTFTTSSLFLAVFSPKIKIKADPYLPLFPHFFINLEGHSSCKSFLRTYLALYCWFSLISLYNLISLKDFF